MQQFPFTSSQQFGSKVQRPGVDIIRIDGAAILRPAHIFRAPSNPEKGFIAVADVVSTRRNNVIMTASARPASLVGPQSYPLFAPVLIRCRSLARTGV